jgi:hypothetical protein
MVQSLLQVLDVSLKFFLGSQGFSLAPGFAFKGCLNLLKKTIIILPFEVF